MTREEALALFQNKYSAAGGNVGADELNDFENIFNQSAEAGLYSGPGYGHSLESLMANYAPRIKERHTPTEGRVVDSQSNEATAIYGGRPEDRATSGAGAKYVDPSSLPRGFAPFALNANPQVLSSLFSRMGGNTGFSGGSARAGVSGVPQYSYAPDYTMANPNAAPGQQLTGGSARAQYNLQRGAGGTTSMGLQTPRRQSVWKGQQQPNTSVRSRLNAQTGLGLT